MQLSHVPACRASLSIFLSGGNSVYRFVMELTFIQACIGPFFRQQLLMCPLFGDAPIFENDDEIGPADRRKSVGNDQGRPALGELEQSLLYQMLGFGIE